MTKPELPETTPTRDHGAGDSFDDAIAWFTGRTETDQAPAAESAELRSIEETADRTPTSTESHAPATPEWDADPAARATSTSLDPDAVAELHAAQDSAVDRTDDTSVREIDEDVRTGDDDRSDTGVIDRDEPVVAEAAPEQDDLAETTEYQWDEPPADAIDSEADAHRTDEAYDRADARDRLDAVDRAEADDLVDAEHQTTDRGEPPASLYREEEAAAVGAGTAGAAGLAAFATQRDDDRDAEVTRVVEPTNDDEAALRRAEEREARDRQLGTVQPLAAAPAVVPHALPTTYRFAPSLGLFLLRIVTATLVGLRAFTHFIDIPGLQNLWASHSIFTSQAGTIAWVQAGVEALIAVMLLFGLGTRIAGLLLAVLATCVLVFTMWGAGNPFQAGVEGFIGELQILLAAIGVFFLTTGGGRWAIDGTIHKGKVDRKNERLLA